MIFYIFIIITNQSKQDSQPRGIIKLLPNSWCTPVIPGSPRMTDAVAKTARTSIMSVVSGPS